MTQTPRSRAHSPIAFVSAGVYTEPDGLSGLTNSTALVRSVDAASSWSTVTLNEVSSVVSTTTGTPPASVIASGYVVQYGAGHSTSSPGSHSTAKAVNTACLPPFVTSTCAGSHWNPESRRVLSAIACLSSGKPAAGVYTWFLGSRQAAAA